MVERGTFSRGTAWRPISGNPISSLALLPPPLRVSTFANNLDHTTAGRQLQVQITNCALTTTPSKKGRPFQKNISCPMGTTLLCDKNLIPKYYLNSDGRWSRIPYARYSPHLFGDAPFKKRRLFVLGLPPETTQQNLYNYFAQFGTLDVVEIKYLRESSDCRGCAYVTYMSIHDSDAVLNFKPHVFLGRTLEVKRANRVVEGQDIPVEDPIEGYRINFVFYEMKNKEMAVWEFRTIQKFLYYFKQFGKVLLIEGENKKGFVVFKDMEPARQFIQLHYGYHIIDDYGLRAELSLLLYPYPKFDEKGIKEVFKDVRGWNTRPHPPEKTSGRQDEQEICSIPGFLRHFYDPRPSSSKPWNPFYV